MAERSKVLEALLGNYVPPKTSSVAEALLGRTGVPRPPLPYLPPPVPQPIPTGPLSMPPLPPVSLRSAFGKDMATLPSRLGNALSAPVGALNRLGSTLTGQEGGWTSTNQVIDDANTLAGLVSMSPGVPAGGLGMGMKSLSAIENVAKSKGVSLAVSETPTRITVSKIVVPKEIRNGGIGTKVMDEIAAYADATGKDVVLTPDGSFGGSVPKLKRFYSRLGFKDNAGKHKDFTTRETMIRPVTKLST